MILATVLNILVQISTSASHICNNDTTKKMQGLHISDNDSVTKDYACTSINENIIEQSANPNNHETDICVDDCETKETDVANQVDRNLKKPIICEYEKNEIGFFTDHERKIIQNAEIPTNMHLGDESSSSGSFSVPEDFNYIIRANKRMQIQARSKKIIKVGFNTEEILEFIRARKEKRINEDKCKINERELKNYFDFLEDHLPALFTKITSKDLRRKFLHEYISARKEIMIYYNTYKIFESEIKDFIEVEEMKPCDDRIERDFKVAKEIIKSIQNRTCLNIYGKNFITSKQEFDLYVRFNLSIIRRFVDEVCDGYPLIEELKFLEERVKFEYAEFNHLMPNDKEIEAFVKEKISSTDSSGNKISKAKNEFSAEQIDEQLSKDSIM